MVPALRESISWVVLFKIPEFVEGLLKVAVQFPSVIFWGIPLPLYKKVGLSTDVLGIENIFDFVVIFVLILNWKRGFRHCLGKKSRGCCSRRWMRKTGCRPLSLRESLIL